MYEHHTGSPATKSHTEMCIRDRNYSAINVPLMRYANVLLMKAEALNEQGHPEQAIPLINEVSQRKIFALDRHHKGIGGGQGVERKQSQGWRAVNEDKIEAAPNHIQRPF